MRATELIGTHVAPALREALDGNGDQDSFKDKQVRGRNAIKLSIVIAQTRTNLKNSYSMILILDRQRLYIDIRGFIESRNTRYHQSLPCKFC